MPAKRKCPSCGSKRWRKIPQSGQISCVVCHLVQEYRNETYEGVGFGPHTMRKRALKSKKKLNEKRSSANPVLYHGDRARYHYFECLQVLLRMQIKKLTELWNLPPDFETICRDTWALHLSLLSSLPPPEPYLHTEEQYVRHQTELPGKGKEDEITQKEEEHSGDAVTSSSDADSLASPDDEGEDATDESIDENMSELLREASETDSSESGGEEQGPSLQGKGTSRKPRKVWRRNDSPAATISVLVHSCWIMRIPVMYKDIINLIETYTLPYLDPIRLLPASLTRHLTKHTKQALSPHRSPTPVFLHAITSRLSKLCFERYGIYTPELNTAPILWRTVCHMAGTLTLYAISKGLARYLELPLTLNPAMAPPVLKRFKRDPTSHKSDNIPPEVALVATVVIVLKIIYGLDGKETRYPMEDWDPAWTMPGLDLYLDRLRVMDTSDFKASRGVFSPDVRAGVQEEDEENLDAYLVFCERALLDDAVSDSKAVEEYFPLQKCMEPAERNGSVLGAIHATNQPSNDESQRVLAAVNTVSGEAKSTENTVRPGESHVIYSAHDVFGMLPDAYEDVLIRAAHWTGVNVDDLNAVIERFERRLVRLWKRSKRRPRMRTAVDAAAESDSSGEYSI
ncbi:uncharacterized protein FOMMEDRAFT_88501 [Fomitiporia mediterranea MF3/22]|uniref:uncharacterized protein n=1 Tax=Fomitiporia mediterranea (strain MF3/22) TaxID=694068 RepID=UPI00044076E4|nr:uncharacterized protein FOMMEDRAFT_88501 [Fomitiporia mediterranea MF3/22]EJD01099.1 hypothetical protein FOMMEDRAFT_88501 [Fomitiporia mediterranea MF3/22]